MSRIAAGATLVARGREKELTPSRPPARRRAPRSWPTLLAISSLLVIELAIFALVTARRELYKPGVYKGPLSSWQPTPLAHRLPHLTYSTHSLRIAFLVLLGAMFVPYLFALARAEALGARWVVGSVLAAYVLVLAGPLFVTDVYNYVDFARLAVVHHLNPYVVGPAAVPRDPFRHLATWPLQATSYGPLFTLGTYPLALLSPSHAVWAYKLVSALAALTCVGLVYLCASRLRRPARACALAVGLNPVLLIYAAGGAHNDFLMMAFALGAIYLILSGRPDRGAPALVASLGIKATAAPIVLFALIGARRLRTAALVAAGCVVLGLLTVLVFGVHFPGFSAQARVITPLSIPDAVGQLIGVDTSAGCPVVYTCARHGVRIGATLVLVAGMALLAWRAWRGADWLTCAGWAMVLIVITLTSTMPWYLAWVLPLAVLSRSRLLHAATAGLTVLLLAGSVPATFLIVPH